jgi:DNA-binding MarR family transcriptional regulator
MESDPQETSLLKALDSSLLRLHQERSEGQKRLAKRASRLAGIDLGYSSILIFETLSEKELRVTELAELLRMTAPTVTRQIQDLESKGLIDRTPDRQDGRASILKLSKEGLRVAETIGSLRIERLQRALDGLSLEDVEHLQIALERLGAALRDA